MTSPAPFVWVETEEQLAHAADALSRASALGVDTEADSFYHYFHKCCLIQISDGTTAYLIDPLGIKRMDSLGAVLGSPSITKVLHAAEQDVLYLRRDYGFTLEPVFDTMIAAQLLGRPSIGLAGLLSANFGVVLDKKCQRDDWSRRPLTERQKTYAAEDVLHLIPLRDLLRDDLKASGRLEWAEEEFALVAQRVWEQRDFDREDFWGIRGARDLAPRHAAILRELYVMRDGRSREGDVPPFRILSDETLLALARKSPLTPEDLEGIKGVTPLVRRRIGAAILAAVREGQSVPEHLLPSPPRGAGRRKTAAFRVRVERLRDWRKQQSAALGLDPGVLFPHATLEALASAGVAGLETPEHVPGLRQWRRRLILPEAGRLLA